MYVLTVIHPPVAPAMYGKSEVSAVAPSVEGAALFVVSHLMTAPYHPTSEEARQFAAALERELPGTQRCDTQTGLTFRIDPADNAPHPCPCGEGEDNTCGRLVLPDDHADAIMEDAYCTGCFTWNRGDVQCLPANTAHTAHTEEP